MRTKDVPIDDVKPYPDNPRRDHDVPRIATSIRAFGFRQPIVVGPDGYVVAGHGRLLAARELGLDKVPVHVADDLTEEQCRAYRIADNRSAEGSEWDERALLAELEMLDEDRRREAGYDEDDEAELRRRIEQEELAAADHDGEDDVPDPPTVPVTKPGDLWRMGEHLLACGDCTDSAVVALLGDHGHLMVTDPPYGVNYDPSWRDDKLGDGNRSLGKVARDDEVNWNKSWTLFHGDVAYIWSADRSGNLIRSGAALESAGFNVRALIIWRKQHFAIGQGNYHYQHEPCWYAVRNGKKAHWRGDRTQSTVWDISTTSTAFGGNADDGKTNHSTQKPVECMRRPMVNNSNEGDLVYDPFVGSGTSIIAAESIGRRCRAIEIDPVYCDMTVDRWQRFTGKQATLDATGETFDDLRAAQAVEAAE